MKYFVILLLLTLGLAAQCQNAHFRKHEVFASLRTGLHFAHVDIPCDNQNPTSQLEIGYFLDNKIAFSTLYQIGSFESDCDAYGRQFSSRTHAVSLSLQWYLLKEPWDKRRSKKLMPNLGMGLGYVSSAYTTNPMGEASYGAASAACIDLTAGLQCRLNSQIWIDLSGRISRTDSDWIDGYNSSSLSNRHNDGFSSVCLGLRYQI